MANLTHRNAAFHIDNASAALTNISAYVNQQDLDRTIGILEDTGMGLEEATFLPGLGGTKFTINGFVNTTTDGIFGVLVSDNTSLTKTVAYGVSSTRFYKGEVWAGNVKYSGTKDTLQTFSADLTVTGAVTRTSIVGT